MRCGSIDFNARELHHLCPLLGVFDDEPGKVAGRTNKRNTANFGELPPRWLSKGHIHLCIQPVNDFGGRVLRRGGAVPLARLVAKDKIAQSRPGEIA